MTTLTNKEIDATVYNLIQELINDGFKIDSTKTYCLSYSNTGDYKMLVVLRDKNPQITAEVVEQVTACNYYTSACIKYCGTIIHRVFNTFYYMYDNVYSDSKDEATKLMKSHNKDRGYKTLDDLIKIYKRNTDSTECEEDKTKYKSSENTPKYDSLNDYIKTATFCKSNLNDLINTLLGGK